MPVNHTRTHLQNLRSFKFLDGFSTFKFSFKWLLIALLVAVPIGAITAFFLISLDKVTNIREARHWLIWLLPFAGLLVGCIYHYWGNDVVKGNDQLIEEIQEPNRIIPLKMAPLVLFGTLITHLFGGSAGREGTAVQMGGAIADQFTKWLKLHNEDRKILLICGISAGFAAVFGTPLAGAVFALEVYVIGRMRYEAVLPSLLAAVMADLVCRMCGAGHTHYSIPFVPELNALHLMYALLAGIVFGFTGRLFANTTHFFSDLFREKIAYPPLRPFVGGIIVALIIIGFGAYRYAGLGIPTIAESFTVQQGYEVFLIKLLLTAITIGCKFKGGEVTPLFFIGAACGSALSLVMPLPVALLAGMGFVGVFAAAANTPIACILMGIELFGNQGAVYIALACVVAYLFSGHNGIYKSQLIGAVKLQSAQQDKRLYENQDR